MQARRYAAANIRSVSRNWDDLPPLASDDEVVQWGKELNETSPELELDMRVQRQARRNRPLVATRTNSSMSTEELLVDISDRASEAYARLRRGRVTVRR
jgi:hypothetical protein